jgi:hypothetical protein
MLDGLALLMPFTVIPSVRPPPMSQVPSVRGDRRLVSLLANMVLQTHLEVKHAY